MTAATMFPLSQSDRVIRGRKESAMNGISVGDKVRGTYMHAPFTGTVRSHRQHTINYRVFLTFVDLDCPVEIKAVGRTEDDGLLLHTAWDGSVLSSDAGDWGDSGDFLEVI